MIQKQNVIIISCLILSLIKCTPPPTPKYEEQIKTNIPKPVIKGKKPHLSFKRLADATLTIENSTATTYFHDTYRTLEHKIILIPHNLPSGAYYPDYSFELTSSNVTYKDISISCEILDKNGGKKDCKASYTLETNKIVFKTVGKIYDGYQLIVNYQYKDIRKNSADILYKSESVSIPIIRDSSFCDYKYIIPNGYKSLGLKNNNLKKVSENTYSYSGVCSDKQLTDEIRFSPKETEWEAVTTMNVESSTPFTNNITLIFPRYYRGGKLDNKYYKILYEDNKEYNENEITYEYIKYQTVIPPSNKLKVSVDIKTNFTNKLDDEFKADVPENYYSINLSAIDQEIQNKANEIKNQNSKLENYQKIGKWINSHMNYDKSYIGKVLTLKEIYKEMRGVCEHYTLLYNAMLNSIGIKTLYISGWAFEDTETSGDEKTIGHAWTVALINGKWKELDSTWGLFDGISAAHIFKNFGDDVFSYTVIGKNKNEISIARTPNIKMITEPKSIEKVSNLIVSDESDTETTTTNNDRDDTSEDIPLIRIDGYYGKPSLLLLLLLCFL